MTDQEFSQGQKSGSSIEMVVLLQGKGPLYPHNTLNGPLIAMKG